MNWDGYISGPLPIEMQVDSDKELEVEESSAGMEVEACPTSGSEVCVEIEASEDSPLLPLEIEEGSMSIEEGPMLSCSGLEVEVEVEAYKIDPRPWFHRIALGEQAQVFLANATSALRQMPLSLLKCIAKCLHISRARQGNDRYAHSIVGRLLGCSGRTVKRCLQNLVKNSWQPASVVKIASATATRRSPSASAGGLPPPQDAKKEFRNAVRLAMSSLVEGHSRLEYERHVARWELCGWVLPMPRCRGRAFCCDVGYLGARIVQHLDAADLHRPLGALGIPSDFGILIDPVSIGASKFARHDTVLMEVLSAVSPHTHQIHTPMFGGHSLGLGGHAGDELVRLTMDVLREHPAGLKALCKVSACSQSDGAQGSCERQAGSAQDRAHAAPGDISRGGQRLARPF